MDPNTLIYIIEKTPDFISVSDLDGNILYINEGGKILLGIPANQETIHLKIKDIHPDWAFKIINEIGLPEVKAKGKWIGETALKTFSEQSNIIPVSQVILSHYSSSGVLEYYSTFIRDISSQKTLEFDLQESLKNLKDSEQKFSKAFMSNSTLMGISRLSDGKFIEVNEAFLSVLGFNRTEVIGKSSIELNIFNVEQRNKIREELVKTGHLRHFEANFQKKDGTNITGLFSAEIIDFKGEKCLVASIYDISELRRYQEELKASEQKYKNLVENSRDLIFSENLKGEFIYLNSSFEQVLGWSNEELLRKDISHLIHPEDKNQVISAHQAIFQGEIVKNVEYRFMTKAGIYKYISTNAQPIFDSNGKVVEIYGIGRDISDLKKMETEKIQNQKIESLGFLAGGIAHDFNNILVGILGNISLLQLTIKSNEDETHEILKDLELAAKRATELTTQLLTFSKGGEPLQKPENIINIINFAIKLAMHGSKSKCILNFIPDLPSVFVDQSQIQQVISNLLINAVQAMENGGNIIINVTTENDELSYVKISIKDEGHGIPKHIQDKIFSPYFTTKTNGTGLGLATAFSIIKRHHGKIWFTSEENKGTEFNILLPACSALETPTQSINDSKLTKYGKIWILEDDLVVQKTLNNLLKSLNQKAEFFSEGKSLLKTYYESYKKGDIINLIIMDLTIPGGMGGKETVIKIHEINPTQKVIVSSGYFNDPIPSNFHQYGFADVLAKPYTIEQLITILEKHL